MSSFFDPLRAVVQKGFVASSGDFGAVSDPQDWATFVPVKEVSLPGKSEGSELLERLMVAALDVVHAVGRDDVTVEDTRAVL